MNAFIDSVLTPFLLFMAEWSLRWAILAALPIGWLLLQPPRGARLRYNLCLVTIAAGLALPLLPRWGDGIYREAVTSTLEQPASHESASPPPGFDIQRIPEENSQIVADSVTNAPPTNDPAGTDIVQSQAIVDWWTLGRREIVVAILAGWLGGVSFLLVRLAAGLFCLRRLRRTATPVDAAADNLLAACRRDLGTRRRVRLALHVEVASPLTLGPWRPTILLPTSWQDLPPALQRGSLLHELAHVQRRDDWLALWVHAVGVVFVFHPCVRWLRSRLECEREILCDEMALGCGVDARAYAAMLRDFASRTKRLPSVMPALPFGQGPTVKRRIQQIIEEIMVPSQSASRWMWFLGAAMVAGSVAIGSLRLWAAAEAPQNQTESKSDSREMQVLDAALKKFAQQYKAEQLPQPFMAKGLFMFGGKSFEQWQAIMRADLKPEVRIEAFQALSTFGKNGYADEAARAIIEIAATYDPATSDRFDRKVVASASDEIKRLGPLAIPALQAELLGGKTSGRRFAAAGTEPDAIGSQACNGSARTGPQGRRCVCPGAGSVEPQSFFCSKRTHCTEDSARNYWCGAC